jgi:dTDP-4-dehydrorhamnose 3,5-epimerase
MTGLAVVATHFDAVMVVATARHADARGHFSETYSARDFAAAGIGCAFVQDNQSLSREKGTIRGLHFQLPPAAQAKLVRVVRGGVFDVAVDLRTGSPTFGRHASAVLSAGNGHQIFIPVGFAHGFCTLEPDTEVFYKVDAPYSPAHERGLRWDDPALAIAWPEGAKTLSEKDRALPLLSELRDVFEYAPA